LRAVRESARLAAVANAAAQHYDAVMSSTPPDLAELAKRYVALWQDYLSATAADADLADAMARFITSFGAFAGYRPAPPEAPIDDGAPEHDAPRKDAAGREAPPGPSPAAAASGERDDAVADLARRLAALERRIAALEARARDGGAAARGPSRRRRF
jgi:hypothetical protein